MKSGVLYKSFTCYDIYLPPEHERAWGKLDDLYVLTIHPISWLFSGIDEADEELPEEPLDNEEMPPLEGDEDDASRMEEVD